MESVITEIVDSIKVKKADQIALEHQEVKQNESHRIIDGIFLF